MNLIVSPVCFEGSGGLCERIVWGEEMYENDLLHGYTRLACTKNFQLLLRVRMFVLNVSAMKNIPAAEIRFVPRILAHHSGSRVIDVLETTVEGDSSSMPICDPLAMEVSALSSSCLNLQLI